MDTPTAKCDRYDAIISELRDIYLRKNHDYGDSFSESVKEWGYIAAIVRMDDKMRRLKQLIKNNDPRVDESIKDTLTDLANYAIMTLMED